MVSVDAMYYYRPELLCQDTYVSIRHGDVGKTDTASASSAFVPIVDGGTFRNLSVRLTAAFPTPKSP